MMTVFDDDMIDGCAEDFTVTHTTTDDEVDELVLTASVTDRDDRAAIEARLAEYRELFDVRHDDR